VRRVMLGECDLRPVIARLDLDPSVNLGWATGEHSNGCTEPALVAEPVRRFDAAERVPPPALLTARAGAPRSPAA
jgi:hypothetical protein